MKKIFFSLIFSMLASFLYAQQKINGTVTGKADKAPLAGVSVQSKQKITLTDNAGKFSIEASVGDILTFSYTGMQTVTVNVTGAAQAMDIVMEPNVKEEDAVVVTGYTTQRKSDLTGSIEVVNMASTKDLSSGSTLQNIQGRVPGLYITSDGSPSGAARSTLIRGVNTLGNTNPLYVIDGVPTTDPNIFQFMDPNTVESVQVLKDASASSIYGSRASNGVIIVTTRQGKNNVSVTVNSSISVASYNRPLSMMNTEQFGATLWQASVNGGSPTSAHSALYSFEEHTDNGAYR